LQADGNVVMPVPKKQKWTSSVLPFNIEWLFGGTSLVADQLDMSYMMWLLLQIQRHHGLGFQQKQLLLIS